MTHTVQLTKEQAAHVADLVDQLNIVRAKLGECLGFAIAGHAPAGAAFVSVSRDTGVLTVQTPDDA